MKKFVIPLSILSIVFLSFCKKTEISFFTSFPQSYLHTGIEKVEVKIFVKSSTDYTEIQPVGTFLNIENDLFSEFKDGYQEILYFNSINFTSETDASLKNNIPDNVFGTQELSAKHSMENSIINLKMADINNPGSLTIPFEIDASNNNKIKTKSNTVKCSFHLNGQIRYSNPDVHLYPQISINDLLKETSTTHNLSVGDTIAIQVSNLNFDLQ
jgi:hypothetical protein